MIPAGKCQSEIESRRESLLPLLVLAGGLLARLYEAWAYFLNPDEALHNLLASQTSLVLSYKAALTNAHPPLLIFVLYYWRLLGQSELMLALALGFGGDGLLLDCLSMAQTGYGSIDCLHRPASVRILARAH